ncbi:hypothetical protein CEQ30_02885 [Nocardia brasiliensis]|nr:hypothetical protein CEQ30_02885 [Nocardia brasiliensis]
MRGCSPGCCGGTWPSISPPWALTPTTAWITTTSPTSTATARSRSSGSTAIRSPRPDAPASTCWAHAPRTDCRGNRTRPLVARCRVPPQPATTARRTTIRSDDLRTVAVAIRAWRAARPAASANRVAG